MLFHRFMQGHVGNVHTQNFSRIFVPSLIKMLRTPTFRCCVRSIHKLASTLKPDTIQNLSLVPPADFFKRPLAGLASQSSGNRFRELHERPQKMSKRPQRPAGPNRRVRFENTTGSDLQREALKWVLGRVRELSPNFRIKVLVKGQLQNGDFIEVANKLNLKEKGVQMINQDNHILIKIVPVEVMAKMYLDHLAGQREQELIQLGNSKMQKILANRARLERKKLAQKVVQIKWGISLADLKQQKHNELKLRITKGESFIIELSSQKRDKRMDEAAYQMELKKRELVFDTLEGLLSELPCSFEFDEGSLEGKVILQVTLKATPAPAPAVVKAETKTPKREKKQVATPVKQKSEDDLDSMYSFKIE